MFAHIEKVKMKVILGSLEVTFIKKATGTITAKAELSDIPTTPGKHVVIIPVSLRNKDGVEVANVVAKWSVLIS